MHIIGDVHGKLSEYKSLLQTIPESIALGDVGFRKEYDWIKEICECWHFD